MLTDAKFLHVSLVEFLRVISCEPKVDCYV
jgi:hypothetical protein